MSSFNARSIGQSITQSTLSIVRNEFCIYSASRRRRRRRTIAYIINCQIHAPCGRPHGVRPLHISICNSDVPLASSAAYQHICLLTSVTRRWTATDAAQTRWTPIRWPHSLHICPLSLWWTSPQNYYFRDADERAAATNIPRAKRFGSSANPLNEDDLFCQECIQGGEGGGLVAQLWLISLVG